MKTYLQCIKSVLPFQKEHNSAIWGLNVTGTCIWNMANVMSVCVFSRFITNHWCKLLIRNSSPRRQTALCFCLVPTTRNGPTISYLVTSLITLSRIDVPPKNHNYDILMKKIHLFIDWCLKIEPMMINTDVLYSVLSLNVSQHGRNCNRSPRMCRSFYLVF